MMKYNAALSRCLLGMSRQPRLFYLLMGTFTLLHVQNTCAFFDAKNFSRPSHTTRIEIVDQTATVTIEQTIQNISAKPQNFQFFQPIPAEGQIEHYFVEAQGEAYQLLTEDEKFSTLWNLAQNTKITQLLSPLANDSQTIFQSYPTEILPSETKHFKLTYVAKIKQAGDLQFFSMPNNDRITSDRTDIYFQIKGKNPIHFWHNLPLDGLIEKNPDGLAYWYWSENLPMHEPIHFYWSEAENFITTYETEDQTFTAKIIAPKPPTSFQKISLIIDTSGSMSGNKWYLVEDLVEWLLDTWTTETDIQIKLHSQLSSSFLTDGFTANSRDLHKLVHDRLPNFIPLGKFETDHIFDQTEGSDLVILITDEENSFVLPEDKTVVVLGFNENESITRQIMLQSGFWLKLFSTTTDIIQTPDLQKKFAELRSPIVSTTENFLPNQIQNFTDQTGNWFIEREFNQRPPFTSPFAKGRTEEGFSSENNPSSFLPLQKEGGWNFLKREWAKLKMADIFRKIYATGEVTIAQVDDLLFLGRNYGVQTSWFNAETRQAELQSILSKPTNIDQIPYKNWFLEQRNLYRSTEQPQFFGDTPVNYYPEENIWRSVDYYQKLKPELLIEIAPFSAAAKDLLKRFPDIFAPLFAFGEQVEVCLEWKCFSVKSGHRTESKTSDWAFVYDFPSDHWASDYLVQLVNEGVIIPDYNGNIDPEKILTRGELANMLLGKLSHKNAETLHATSLPINQIFTDIPTDSPYYAATKILAEQKIMNGFIDGEFKPFERITRAQALKTIMALNGLNPETGFDWAAEPIFIDAQGWERPWVEAAFSGKKINGEVIEPHRYFWSTRSVKLGELAKLLVEFSKN